MRLRLETWLVLLATLLTATAVAAGGKSAAPPFPRALDVSELSEKQRARVHRVWNQLQALEGEKSFLEKKRVLEKALKRLRMKGVESAALPYLTGLIHKTLEDYDDAEAAFRTAAERQPDFSNAWKYLALSRLEVATTPKGKSLRRKNRLELLESALEAVDKALAATGKDFETHFIRVRILLALGQQHEDPNKEAGEDGTSKEWVPSPHYLKAQEHLSSVLRRARRRSKGYMQLAQLQLHVTQACQGAPQEWRKSGDYFVARKKHYRVVTSHSQEVADDIVEQANFIYRVYKAKIFKDIPEPRQIFNVFVYTDFKDYVKLGGGMPGSLGFYSPYTRILVVFYNEDDPDQDALLRIILVVVFYNEDDPEQSILVLNHEAMHQFVHDNLKNAPMWFNEGLGDYFGPYKRVGKTRMESAPNLLRLNDNPRGGLGIRSLLRKKLTVDIKELMLKTHQEFYDPTVVVGKTSAALRNYAQAWSLMYFMNETPGGRPYMKALLKYYALLRKGRHPHVAFEETFAKIDLDKMELDWRFEILTLK